MEIYSNRYTTASLTAIIATLLLLGAVFAAGDTAPTIATVTVDGFLSVSLTSGSPIAFGSMNPDERDKPTVGPLVATIGSESNVDAKVGTKANVADFVCIGGGCTTSTDKFAVSYLEWAATDNFPGINYTTNNAEVCASVSAGSGCNIYHELEIPGATPAGNYDVTITITATQVGT